MSTSGYKPQNRSTERQIQSREELYELYRSSPLPVEEMMVNLGLYMRSGALAKVMFLNEIYEKIVPIPGCIAEFGTWWGQSLILFENFRAIYEPYNYTRRVIGFDTYEGYPAVGARDRRSETIKEGGYATTKGYDEYLKRLIAYHEGENVMHQVQKHTLVKGDVTVTAPQYFAEHPETIVALAFLDLALYEPTKAALQAIAPRLVKGSVVAMDELNCPDYPGETQAVVETLGLRNFRLHRSRFLPDRSYFVVE